MLKIRKTAISFGEQELAILKGIVIKGDEKEALKFLKKYVYEQAVRNQRGCEVLYGERMEKGSLKGWSGLN